MALTVRTNGSSSPNIITASWFNDFLNLLTGSMQDQEVTIKNALALVGIQAGPTVAPSVALTAGTTLGIGLYCYAYTWVSADGGETIASPNANITTTTGNQKVNITNIAVGPTGTVARNIYRTKVGCSVATPEQLIGTLNNNTATTFTDAVADGSLGASVPHSPTFGGALFVKNAAGTLLAKINNDGRFDPAGITSVVNGSVGGTATFWVPVWGSGLKIVLVNEINYNSASTTTLYLPQPNYSFGIITGGNYGNTVSVLLNSAAQNIQLLTSLGTASAGGGSASTTVMHANSLGQFASIDAVQLSSTGGSAWNGETLLIGF
jgi:hypothetical protein